MRTKKINGYIKKEWVLIMNVKIDNHAVNELGHYAHVLLIDDEEFLVRLWRYVIEKYGYKVTSFTEGLLALEEFRANSDSYDIVITDQAMPGITGCELIDEMLKIRGDIKIILCSGYLGETEIDNAVYKKISKFLMKPFNIYELIEAIEVNI